jgi:Rod binding domain-containing protein
MFTEMLDAELARSLSASGGIGLSAMVQRQLEIVPEIGKTNPTE